MKQATFGNFQVGMLDNPSVEDKGGFEFASGMDIFSEPGVMKAALALVPVTLGAGANLTQTPTFLVDTAYSGAIRGYIIAGTKILESSNGSTWNLFLTNTIGENSGLGIWNGYVVYASGDKLGRTLIGQAAGKNDSFATIDTDGEHHPMISQGGTFKIGCGRYVASLNEAFTLTGQAMKLPAGYRIRCFANYLTKLFMGTRIGDGMSGAVTTKDASVFDWRGTVLSSGSALPDNPYPLELFGMNAFGIDGERLYAFPDKRGQIFVFSGIGFVPYKTLFHISKYSSLEVARGAVTQNGDTMLFGGEMSSLPGVFQMKDGAVCQSLIPSKVAPGANKTVSIKLVKTSFGGQVFVAYYNGEDNTYNLERTSSDRQNNAICNTAYHRISTDKLKRWGGVKLNLKPLPEGTAVDVSYRTQRDAAFTPTGITVTSANQDKPLLFRVQPRSRELQLQLKYTTHAASTPELLTYDLLYEVLTSNR